MGIGTGTDTGTGSIIRVRVNLVRYSKLDIRSSTFKNWNSFISK